MTVPNGDSVASIREGRGNIVNVASMYGLIGSAPHIPATAYVAAKHGVYYSPSETGQR
jgi:NAD(P)-dependent dehydrogenase (short-subunit alcohol dehydrogenase family)